MIDRTLAGRFDDGWVGYCRLVLVTLDEPSRGKARYEQCCILFYLDISLRPLFFEQANVLRSLSASLATTIFSRQTSKDACVL